MTKRLISIALFVAIIFSVSAYAFANDGQTSVVSSPEYTPDYDFAVSLGIMSEDINPASAIKRIELARCFANLLLANTSKESSSASRYFSDVDYADALFADAVADAKIMNGTGNGQFNPEGLVTYNQLIKTFVSFLGYDAKAQSLGGYPAGYMYVANTLGLNNHTLKISPEDYVTGETVGMLFKSAVNSAMYEQPVLRDDGTEVYIENGYSTYLEKYLDVKVMRGVVKGVHGNDLSYTNDLDFDELVIEKTKFSYDPKRKDLSQKLGLCANVYYKVEKGENFILYFEEYGNEIIKINNEDMGTYSNGIVYYVGNKEKKIKTDGHTRVLYNNTICKTYPASIFNPWKDQNLDGSLTSIDNNDDGIADFVFIDAYETYTVSSVVNNVVIPMYRDTVMIDLGDYSDGKTALIRNLNGEPVSLDKIQRGNVLSVSKNLDGTVTSVIVTIDEYTGILDGYEHGNGIHYFTIGGTVFKSSKSLNNSTQLPKVEVGKTMKLVFNKDGLVSDIDVSKYLTTSLGYITDAKPGQGMDGENDILVKIFTSGGSFESFWLADKVTTFYGIDSSVCTPAAVMNKIGYTPEGRVKRQAIMYRRNEDGKINWIYICNNADGAIDGFYKFQGTIFADSSNDYEYRQAPTNCFGGQILLNATPIIIVPEEENRDDDVLYRTFTPVTGQKYPVAEAYGTRKNSRVASLVVLKDEGTAGRAETVVVVERVTETMDDEGIPSVKIKGKNIKTDVEFFGSKQDVMNGLGGELPQCGDVLKIQKKDANKIYSVSYAFDESERVLSGSISGYSSSKRYLFGEITWSDEESMLVKLDGTGTIEAYMKPETYAYYKVVTENRKKVLKTALPQEFMSYPETKYLFIYSTSGDPKFMVLYE